jgi:hypothetical protein
VTVLQQLRHSGYLGFLYTRMQKRHRGKETEMAPPFADNSEPVSHHPHYSYCLLFTETKDSKPPERRRNAIACTNHHHHHPPRPWKPPRFVKFRITGSWPSEEPPSFLPSFLPSQSLPNFSVFITWKRRPRPPPQFYFFAYVLNSCEARDRETKRQRFYQFLGF